MKFSRRFSAVNTDWLVADDAEEKTVRCDRCESAMPASADAAHRSFTQGFPYGILEGFTGDEPVDKVWLRKDPV